MDILKKKKNYGDIQEPMKMVDKLTQIKLYGDKLTL